MRGGDIEHFLNRVKDLINDRAVKNGIIAVFTAAGLQLWHEEVIELIKNKRFVGLCYNEKILFNNHSRDNSAY